MDELLETGRRHVRISKLYLKNLLKRGPNIFVALAWSQAFWLILEAAAGNADSRGYVRLTTVATYALVLHTGGHLVLRRYQHKLSHAALDFLLDLATDVVGFAWINVAEEMLVVVFVVRARTALMYAVVAFLASLGAMEVGCLGRSFLGWPMDFEETANQFDAGSFALPTSWLITQAVHIGLYGFFYRTSGGQGGRGRGGGKGDEDTVVDIHLEATFFFLAYALLCSLVATRVIGGTVAASTIAVDCSTCNSGGCGGCGDEGSSQNNQVIETISSCAVTAAQFSDANASTAKRAPEVAAAAAAPPPPPRRAGFDTPQQRELPSAQPDLGDEERGAASPPATGPAPDAAGTAQEIRARREALHLGHKAYMRLTVGMMVGWAYNLWGQVEFRQEELEFRFGPALGATAYAALSTALGVCIMARGADKLDARIRKGMAREDGARLETAAATMEGEEEAEEAEEAGREEEEEAEAEAAEKINEDALRSFHARRLLVVVGGVSLVVGWAWAEAIELLLEGLVGDEADAGTIAAKLALALSSTLYVLWREIRGSDSSHRDRGAGRHAVHELLEPLVAANDQDTAKG